LKNLILIVSFLLLTACSNESSLFGEIRSIGENRINVGCSDFVKKANNTHSKDDIGYSCVIKITDETIIKTQVGEIVTLDELNINDIVSVYFDEPTASVESEKLTFTAMEITVFENEE